MIKKIIGFFKNLRDEQRKMCFEEHHSSNNVCYGMIGGDPPDYLNNACINCPYFEVYTRK